MLTTGSHRKLVSWGAHHHPGTCTELAVVKGRPSRHSPDCWEPSHPILCMDPDLLSLGPLVKTGFFCLKTPMACRFLL